MMKGKKGIEILLGEIRNLRGIVHIFFLLDFFHVI